MGFDIVIYQVNSRKTVVELSETSQKELFGNNNLAKEMLISSQLSDFYKTNLLLSADNIKIWLKELNVLNEFYLSNDSKLQLQNLIDALTKNLIEKVHIAGD
jgi:hypothetical protein